MLSSENRLLKATEATDVINILHKGYHRTEYISYRQNTED